MVQQSVGVPALNLVFNFLGGVFSNEDVGDMLSKELHCPCKNDKIAFLFVSPLTGTTIHLGGLEIEE